jgi:uncharacterized protein (TIGR02284 family)
VVVEGLRDRLRRRRVRCMKRRARMAHGLRNSCISFASRFGSRPAGIARPPAEGVRAPGTALADENPDAQDRTGELMSTAQESKTATAKRDAVSARHTPTDVSAVLAESHDELAKSAGRLLDFVKACDSTSARDEWNAFESAVLRHLDAEEMFLLTAFERASAAEAKIVRAEHAEIRRVLGEVGLAFDLHFVSVEQVERLQELLAKHAARETASMYTWAGADRNHLLARAMLRRIGKPLTPGPDGVVAPLVRLVEACRDGERGYRQAAKDVQDEGFRFIFQRYAKERAAFADALAKALEPFGVSSNASGTRMGAFHREWLDASATLARGGAQTILRECQRGDDAAMKLYAAALHAGLPPEIQEMVQDQRASLQSALNEIHSLLTMERP